MVMKLIIKNKLKSENCMFDIYRTMADLKKWFFAVFAYKCILNISFIFLLDEKNILLIYGKRVDYLGNITQPNIIFIFICDI